MNDVDSVSTNAPLKETISVCTNLLYNHADAKEGICRSVFEDPLCLATQESYFKFNDILYKQNDGAAIGSPLGATIANLHLLFYEMK